MKTLLLIVLAISWVRPCQANEIVVPNTNYSWLVPGNSSGGFPFIMSTDQGYPHGSARYQQVYAASQFTNIPADGGRITAFRLRTGYGSIGFGGSSSGITLQSIQINFSTTMKAVGSLNPVFVENIGGNDIIVFGPGPLSLSGSGAISLTPIAGPWDILIPLTTPYYYRPSDGNLLMDVRVFVDATTPFPVPTGWPPYLDAVNTVGDPVSSVYAYTGTGQGNVNSPSGVLSTFGFVTLFEFTPIPEPNSALLLCVAGVMFIFALGRRKESW